LGHRSLCIRTLFLSKHVSWSSEYARKHDKPAIVVHLNWFYDCKFSTHTLVKSCGLNEGENAEYFVA
jgi:hypothetical protein